MTTAPSDFNRAAEALRERAAECALTGDRWSWEDEELARSLGIDLEAELEAFELVAAELAVAQIAGNRKVDDAVPAALRTKLGALAGAPIGTKPATPDARPMAFPARKPVSSLRVPLAAAAGLALGIGATVLVLRNDGRGRGASVDAATASPAAFIRAHPRAVHWPWVGTTDPHVVGPVRGEAYFDPESERGILEIEGLAPNDPTVEQYQLWIFDAERDERYPVDGGVFDVTQAGRVLIPVQARLDVARPVMFAVTVEKPGGVVVSARQIAIVAKP